MIHFYHNKEILLAILSCMEMKSSKSRITVPDMVTKILIPEKYRAFMVGQKDKE
jgi:hypothetical protein